MRRSTKTGLLVSLLLLITLSSVVSATSELVIRYLDFGEEYVLLANDTDVSSGDVTLISTPDGYNILIDSHLVNYSPTLVRRLQELGIEKIDLVFATHPHRDHIGGFPAVFDQFDIGAFYQIDLPYDTSSVYHRLQESIARNNINTSYVKRGDVFQLGEVRLEALNPPSEDLLDLAPSDTQLSVSFVNDLSLVLRLDYKDFSMLFTGDIYMGREMEILDVFSKEDLQVDILDVPHHGHSSSSSSIFINTVEPRYAIINAVSIHSVSVYNKYLQKGREVFITGHNGEIVITTDGKAIDITVDKP